MIPQKMMKQESGGKAKLIQHEISDLQRIDVRVKHGIKAIKQRLRAAKDAECNACPVLQAEVQRQGRQSKEKDKRILQLNLKIDKITQQHTHYNGPHSERKSDLKAKRDALTRNTNAILSARKAPIQEIYRIEERLPQEMEQLRTIQERTQLLRSREKRQREVIKRLNSASKNQIQPDQQQKKKVESKHEEEINAYRKDDTLQSFRQRLAVLDANHEDEFNSELEGISFTTINDKCNSLNTLIGELKASNETLTGRNAFLEKELNRLKEQINQKDAQLIALSEEKLSQEKQMTTRLISLTEAAQDLERQHQGCNRNFEYYQSKIANLETNLLRDRQQYQKQLNDQAEQLILALGKANEWQRSKNEREELKSQLKEEVIRKLALIEEINMLNKENYSLKLSGSSHIQQVQLLSDQNQQLKQMLNDRNEDIKKERNAQTVKAMESEKMRKNLEALCQQLQQQNEALKASKTEGNVSEKESQLTETIKFLQQKVRRVHNELSIKQNAVDSNEKTISQLKWQINKLNKSLDQQINNAKALDSDNKAYRSEINMLTQKCQDLKNQINQITNTSSKQIQLYSEQLSTLIHENQILQAQSNSKDAQLQKLPSEMALLKKENIDLKELLEKTTRKNEEAVKTISIQMKDSFDKEQAQFNSSHQQTINHLSAANEQLNAQIKQMMNEITGIRQAFQQLEYQNSKSKYESAAMLQQKDAVIEQLQIKLNSSNQQFKQAEDNIYKLIAQKSVYQNSLNDLRFDLVQRQDQIVKLRLQNQAVVNQLNSLENANNELKANLQRQYLKNHQLLQQISDTQERIAREASQIQRTPKLEQKIELMPTDIEKQKLQTQLAKEKQKSEQLRYQYEQRQKIKIQELNALFQIQKQQHEKQLATILKEASQKHSKQIQSITKHYEDQIVMARNESIPILQELRKKEQESSLLNNSLRTQYERKTNEVEKLQLQLKELTQLNALINQEIAQKKAFIHETEAKNKQMQEIVHKFSRQNQKLTAQIENLNQKCFKLQSQNRQVLNANTQASEVINKKQIVLKQAERQISLKLQQINKLRQLLSQHQANFNEAKVRYIALERQAFEMNEAIQGLKGQLDNQFMQINALQNENQRLHNFLMCQGGERQRLEQHIALMTDEKEKYMRHIKEVQEIGVLNTGKIDEQAKQILSLKQNIQIASQTLKQTQNELNKSKEALSNVHLSSNTEKDKFNNIMDQNSQITAKLQTQLNELRIRLESAQRQLQLNNQNILRSKKQHQQAIMMLQQQIIQREVQIEHKDTKYQKQIVTNKERISVLQKQLQETKKLLQEELVQRENYIRLNEKQIERVKTQLQTIKRDSEQAKRILQAELAERQTEISDQDIKISEINATHTEQISKLIKENQQAKNLLQQQIAQRQSQISEKDIRISQLEASYKESIQNIVTEYEEEKRLLQQQVVQREAQIVQYDLKLNEQILSIQKQKNAIITQLDSSIKQIQAKNYQQSIEISQLRVRVTELTEEKEKIIAKQLGNQMRLIDLQREIERLTQSHEISQTLSIQNLSKMKSLEQSLVQRQNILLECLNQNQTTLSLALESVALKQQHEAEADRQQPTTSSKVYSELEENSVHSKQTDQKSQIQEYYKAKCEELENNLKIIHQSYQSSINQLEQKEIFLKQSVQTLNQALISSQQQAELNQAAFNDQTKLLQSKLQELSKELLQVKEQLQSNNVVHAQTVQSMAMQHRHEKDKANGEISALTQQLASMTHQFETNFSEINGLNIINKDLENNLNENILKTDYLNERLSLAQQQMQEKCRELAFYERQFSQYRAQNEQLNLKLEQKTNQMKDLESKLKYNIKKYEQSQMELLELEGVFINHKISLEELKIQNKTLKERLEQKEQLAMEKISQKREAIIDESEELFEEIIDEILQRYQVKEQKLQVYSNRLDKIVQNLKKIQKKSEKIIKEKQSAKISNNQHNQTKQELQRAREQINSLTTKCQRLQNDLTLEQLTSGQMSVEKEDQIARLKQEIKQLSQMLVAAKQKKEAAQHAKKQMKPVSSFKIQENQHPTQEKDANSPGSLIDPLRELTESPQGDTPIVLPSQEDIFNLISFYLGDFEQGVHELRHQYKLLQFSKSTILHFIERLLVEIKKKHEIDLEGAAKSRLVKIKSEEFIAPQLTASVPIQTLLEKSSNSSQNKLPLLDSPIVQIEEEDGQAPITDIKPKSGSEKKMSLMLAENILEAMSDSEKNDEIQEMLAVSSSKDQPQLEHKSESAKLIGSQLSMKSNKSAKETDKQYSSKMKNSLLMAKLRKKK